MIIRNGTGYHHEIKRMSILRGQKSDMSNKKQASAPTPKTTNSRLFGKENYTWIIIGIVVVAIGLMLMAGGKSNDPNVFKPNDVYSIRRITIAPIVILIGLGIEVFAIFKKPKF